MGTNSPESAAKIAIVRDLFGIDKTNTDKNEE